jgi:Flp pilus assembly protein TadG
MSRHVTPSHESGQGMVELACSLPLFVILILGGAEIANLAWASLQVNNAARAGAAYASVSRANASSTANVQTAAQNEAPKLTLTTTPTLVCYCVSNTGSQGSADTGCTTTNLTNCASPSSIQVDAHIYTTATVRPLIHYPGLPASYTVQANATVGVEQ